MNPMTVNRSIRTNSLNYKIVCYLVLHESFFIFLHSIRSIDPMTNKEVTLEQISE